MSEGGADFGKQPRGELRQQRDEALAEVARLRNVRVALIEAGDQLRVENEHLRGSLRAVIFDLHNCEYGGDMPRCEHIADALKIARATKPYDHSSEPDAAQLPPN